MTEKTMKKTVYKFWQNLSPTPAHMVLDKNVENYNQEEQKEILSLLPDFSGKHVLELASGIGRFTGHFAQLAKRVDTSDFNPTFLEKNKSTRLNSVRRVLFRATASRCTNTWHGTPAAVVPFQTRTGTPSKSVI